MSVSARLRALDRAATLAVAKAHRPRRTRLLLAVTRLGSQWFLLPATLAASAALLAFGQGRSARLLGVAMLAGWAASSAAKRVFRRDRPDLWPALATEPTHSFPSQHVWLSTVFFGGIGVIVVPLLAGSGAGTAAQLALAAVLGIVVLTIAFSRLYLGTHWTTDVVAGLLIGALWLVLCVAVIGGPAGPLGDRMKPGSDLPGPGVADDSPSVAHP